MAALPLLLAACVDSPVAPVATTPAPQGPPSAMLLTLTTVWNGSLSTDWSTGGNWSQGVVPAPSDGADIPDASLLTSQPVLSADAEITDLRVGSGTTLDLAGFTLTSWGSVESIGQVSNGTLWMQGSSALLAGTVDRLRVGGRVTVDAPVVANGVYVNAGTGIGLRIAGQPLSIQTP
jgi:hypothetical protein